MKTRLHFISHILLIVSLACGGCNDSDSATDAPDVGLDSIELDSNSESNDETKPKEGIPFEVNREIDHVAGHWLLYLKSESSEIPMGELVVEAIPGTDPVRYGAHIMVPNQEQQIQIPRVSVEPESLEVTFINGPQVQIFQGRLYQGIVYGNMIGGEGVCVPARLIRPKQPVMPEPHWVEGVYDFSELLKAGAEWDRIVKFIKDHPESPLLPNVIYSLVMQVRPRKIPAERIQELFDLIDQYAILWGERLKDFVRLNTLMQLSNDYRYAPLLEKIHASLVGKFEEPVWKERVDFFMQKLEEDIKLTQLVDSLRDASPEKQTEILAQLKQESEENRFNVILFASTADALAEVANPQEAIEWYRKLVVVPGLENRYLGLFDRYGSEMTAPSERLTELWKQVHGSEDGLQETLEREYEELLSGFEFPEVEIPDPNGKQVLIELFTGTECPPCIATDLACSILRKRLPQDRVALLQYHVHIPAADPLTCAGSTGRYGYYSPGGTPTLLVNGRVLHGAGGDASAVPIVLQQIMDEVAEELLSEPKMQIEVNVTPSDGGTADFQASVKADEITDRLRLLVVLAEGEVEFGGYNGVPVHEMVVRNVYTSSQGQEPAGGALALSGTIDPVAIRKDLQQRLAKLRETRGVQVADGPLDLDNLYLVAFVQDARSRRVRQVVSVPVPSLSTSKSDSE